MRTPHDSPRGKGAVALDSALRAEPVSSAVPTFRELVESHLAAGEVAVVLLRHANCSGQQDYLLVRTLAEFDEAARTARPKTSITVFLESSFIAKGPADAQLGARAKHLLESLDEDHYGIGIVRLDAAGARLDGEHCFRLADPASIDTWFTGHRGCPILVGELNWWDQNRSCVVTVYVPDADGVVRPGGY